MPHAPSGPKVRSDQRQAERPAYGYIVTGVALAGLALDVLAVTSGRAARIGCGWAALLVPMVAGVIIHLACAFWL